MKNRLSVLVAVMAAVFSTAQAEGPPPVTGKWRITRFVAGPWADPETIAAFRPSDSLIGQSVTFMRDEIVAPAPVGCRRATYTAYDAPVSEMFQGAGLSEEQVSGLGVAGPSVPSFSVSCSLGLYEYHRVSDSSILVGIDNYVWTLDRTAGTRAAAKSAEGVVQRFLERHFAGDMGFAPETIEPARDFLTAGLQAKIAAYFAQDFDPEEVPPIDGDPFTDSQDYPARFAVAAADKSKDGASVPVAFSDAFASRTVLYDLKREKRRWLIDDLVFEDGTRLSALLGG